MTLGLILSGLVFYGIWLIGKYLFKLPFALFRIVKRTLRKEKIFKEKEPRSSFYR